MGYLTLEVAIIGVIGFISPGPIIPMLIDLSKKNSVIYPITLLIGMFTLDLCVIIPSFAISNFLDSFINPKLLGLLSILGGVYLLYLAYNVFNAHKVKNNSQNNQNKALYKVYISGFLLSVLNGGYWMWWGSIGIKYLTEYIKFGSTGIIVFTAALFIPPILVMFILYNLMSKLSSGVKTTSKWRMATIGGLYILFAIKFGHEGILTFIN